MSIQDLGNLNMYVFYLGKKEKERKGKRFQIRQNWVSLSVLWMDLTNVCLSSCTAKDWCSHRTGVIRGLIGGTVLSKSPEPQARRFKDRPVIVQPYPPLFSTSTFAVPMRGWTEAIHSTIFTWILRRTPYHLYIPPKHICRATGSVIEISISFPVISPL